MVGGTENDTAFGGDGDDLVAGQAGDDIVDGGIGNDTLFGEDGLDTLFGGFGDDTLFGGADADVFDYQSGGGLGTDTIGDFQGGVDSVLVGANTVNSGLGSSTVVLDDGTVLIAGNGYLWQSTDFV